PPPSPYPPPFRSPSPALRGAAARRGRLGAAAVLIGLASSSFVLADVLGTLRVPEPLAALNPFTRADVLDLLFGAFLFIATEGQAMLMSAIETAAAAVLVALLAAAMLAAMRRGGGAAVFSVALATLTFSPHCAACEFRRAEGVVAGPAGETVDDTLIALGRDVEINGTVSGDLIALGQRVVIRGSVGGTLVTGARTVEIEGDLGGSVLGAAEVVTVGGGTVARNVYGFAREITIGRDARIDGNGVLFSSTARIDGPVGRDLYGFAAEIEATGRVGGDLVAHAATLRVREPARIEGDVIAHVSDESAVSVSPGTVEGDVLTRLRDEAEGRRERRGGEGAGAFLAGQAVRFGAAFVTGDRKSTRLNSSH